VQAFGTGMSRAVQTLATQRVQVQTKAQCQMAAERATLDRNRAAAHGPRSA